PPRACRIPQPPLFPSTTLFRSPIDGFGVGTQLGTSGDAPALGGVYKLVEDASGPKFKPSTGKRTLNFGPEASSTSLYTPPSAGRSEEHTSELQSRFDLGCRLLL